VLLEKLSYFPTSVARNAFWVNTKMKRMQQQWRARRAAKEHMRRAHNKIVQIVQDSHSKSFQKHWSTNANFALLEPRSSRKTKRVEVVLAVGSATAAASAKHVEKGKLPQK
jgi:hypothetical protein